MSTKGVVSSFFFTTSRLCQTLKMYTFDTQQRVPFIFPVLKIGAGQSNKVVNNKTSSGISQSLTPCLSHNMQRRAFIIFIKTIFLGFLLGDPVSTPHSLRIWFRCGDNPDVFRLYLSRIQMVQVYLSRWLELSLVADPHQNILAEPQAI